MALPIRYLEVLPYRNQLATQAKMVEYFQAGRFAWDDVRGRGRELPDQSQKKAGQPAKPSRSVVRAEPAYDVTWPYTTTNHCDC